METTNQAAHQHEGSVSDKSNGMHYPQIPSHEASWTTPIELPPQERVVELLTKLRERDGLLSLHTAYNAVCPELADPEDDVPYFDVPVMDSVMKRFPWLLALMLVQSVSGFVVESFEELIQQHIILSAFLTMLAGGGGNSSGQTIAELVKRLGRGELSSSQICRVLGREVIIGAFLAALLAVAVFLRVRLLSHDATSLDALAIMVSYVLIIIMANAVGVVTVMALSRCKVERVGAPPVVQVVVDVLGITLTCLVSVAILGVDESGGAGSGGSTSLSSNASTSL